MVKVLKDGLELEEAPGERLHGIPLAFFPQEGRVAGYL